MAKQRDTYKYHFKVGKKVVYRGVTNDLERREALGYSYEENPRHSSRKLLKGQSKRGASPSFLISSPSP